MTEMFSTQDDPKLEVVIEHHRDVIAFDGKIEQDYRFLNYTFKHAQGNVEAMTYLDDVWEVSILTPIDAAAIPVEILSYLKRRFNVVKQRGGPDGDQIIWQKA